MSAFGDVDREIIRKASDLAGGEIRDQKLLGEIVIYAGEVFLLRFSWSDDGRRIEANISLDGMNGPVRQALVRLGRKVGLPDGWL